MRFQFDQRFTKALDRLPNHIQDKANKALDAFIEKPYYPYHPSLRIKKMEGYDDLWEGRVDRFYRFSFYFKKDEDDETTCVFRNIGPHDKLLRNP